MAVKVAHLRLREAQWRVATDWCSSQRPNTGIRRRSCWVPDRWLDLQLLISLVVMRGTAQISQGHQLARIHRVRQGRRIWLLLRSWGKILKSRRVNEVMCKTRVARKLSWLWAKCIRYPSKVTHFSRTEVGSAYQLIVITRSIQIVTTMSMKWLWMTWTSVKRKDQVALWAAMTSWVQATHSYQISR